MMTTLSVLDTRAYHIGNDLSFQPSYIFSGINYSDTFILNRIPAGARLVIDTYNVQLNDMVIINNVNVANLTGYNNKWFRNIITIPASVLQTGTNSMLIQSVSSGSAYNEILISDAQILFDGDFSAEYKGMIVAPSVVTPINYYVSVSDLAGHNAKSQTYSFLFSSTPKINNITVMPLYPGGNDNVTVSAIITSPNVVNNSILYYSLDGVNYTSVKMKINTSSNNTYYAIYI